MSMVSREPLSSRCRLVTRKALEWRASAASAFSATYRRTCSLGLRQPRAHYGVCACLRSAASLHGLIVLSPALRAGGAPHSLGQGACPSSVSACAHCVGPRLPPGPVPLASLVGPRARHPRCRFAPAVSVRAGLWPGQARFHLGH